MAYSHKHRFQRRYGIHYNTKLSVAEIAEISGQPLDTLVEVYNQALAKTAKPSVSILAVYAFCNGGHWEKYLDIKDTK